MRCTRIADASPKQRPPKCSVDGLSSEFQVPGFKCELLAYYVNLIV